MLCSHNIVVCKRKTINGHYQCLRQCTICGERPDGIDGYIKHSEVIQKYGSIESLPDYNKKLYDTNRTFFTDEYIKDENKDCEISDEITEEMVLKYEQTYEGYLSSDKWKHKAQLVRYRAKGICEGCRDMPGYQVHHLHYEHLFDEFLFEFVNLCDDCHGKMHIFKRLRDRIRFTSKIGTTKELYLFFIKRQKELDAYKILKQLEKEE